MTSSRLRLLGQYGPLFGPRPIWANLIGSGQNPAEKLCPGLSCALGKFIFLSGEKQSKIYNFGRKKLKLF